MVPNKMQQFQVLHILILILLTTFTEAQNQVKTICNDMCGGVVIDFPFGIGRNCSMNEWFNVDCNSSTAYLSALNNVEVLYISSQWLLVNVSVISGCENPVQNSSPVLSGSPFRYSGRKNLIVAEGCGKAEIIMENGTIVGGCSSTCGSGSDTGSDIFNCFGDGCCQTTIPHDLQSFTLNRTGLVRRDGDGTCSGSAFLVYSSSLVADILPSRLSIVDDHTFVPVLLLWNGNHTSLECNNTCGEVSIPYPFGIGRRCSGNDWFNVDCNFSKPYLPALNNVEVLSVDIDKLKFTVNVPIISDCQNSSLALSTSPFHFSRYDNLFVLEGCGSATIVDNGTIVTGCSTTCGKDTVREINNCLGIGCCQTRIPYDLKSFTLNLTGNGSCGSAFLVDRNSFIESQSVVENHTFVPVSLSWGYWYGVEDHEDLKCRVCKANGGFCKAGMHSKVTCLYHNTSPSVILGKLFSRL